MPNSGSSFEPVAPLPPQVLEITHEVFLTPELGTVVVKLKKTENGPWNIDT